MSRRRQYTKQQILDDSERFYSTSALACEAKIEKHWRFRLLGRRQTEFLHVATNEIAKLHGEYSGDQFPRGRTAMRRLRSRIWDRLGKTPDHEAGMSHLLFSICFSLVKFLITWMIRRRAARTASCPIATGSYPGETAWAPIVLSDDDYRHTFGD